ncbi:MAG: hypothetical protein FWB88_11090 [Defluviitaleaceae bacterium]|nr:hypothetical protein [Defluviitaleaceae bacterium]MCL2240580.1 hypothetical protein [Defluviitaleaceae bacterium]
MTRISLGKVGHAYILEGESGLLESANAFAKALNCLEGRDEACNGCISCRVFDSGNHPDTLYVTGTKATGIGVDDVREQVLLPMAMKPFTYRCKVFILDKAETLTPAAQNALLKTMEEPAPYGVFLLLAHSVESLLPTVRSRCVVLRHDAGPTEADTQDAERESLVQDITRTAHELDILDAMALYKRFEPYKESKESAKHLLDMLYTAYGQTLRERQSPYAFNAVEAVAHAKKVLAQNGNFQLTIELMLLKICGKLHPKAGAQT